MRGILWLAVVASVASPVGVTEAQTDQGWPRQQAGDGFVLTLYQPQVERWQDDRLDARAAIALQTESSAEPSYAVVSFTARTAVDKPDHVVLLEDVALRGTARLSSDEEAVLRQRLPDAVHHIALDRLQASLAAVDDEPAPATTRVRNEPPRIIVTTRPALLIPIDGAPALRRVPGTRLQRVINTRALLVHDPPHHRYYLYLGDCWMTAKRLDGLWAQLVVTPPAGLDRLRKDVEGSGLVDLFDDEDGKIRRRLERGTVPRVIVSTTPTELIELRGQPDLQEIPGTPLASVTNSDAAIFRPDGERDYYLLVSGRWYRSRTLIDGDWSFVAAPPKELATIPESHPKAWVRASLPGTAEAREAVLANGIPQTATVRRGPAQPVIGYDGEPRLVPIAGTSLRYVANSTTPVVRAGARWYVLSDGVWMVGDGPYGLWQVATSVPDEIYAIPPSSKLHHVRYARIYGVEPNLVHVGYLPGYLGSYVGETGTVVYGTGHDYAGWRGHAWFPAPTTFGAGMHWSLDGGWVAADGGEVLAGGRVHRPVQATSTLRARERSDLDHTDAYATWSPGLVTDDWEPVRVAMRQERVGHSVGANDVYAGRDGWVYRRDSIGWQRFAAEGWRRAEIGTRSASIGTRIFPSSLGELDREREARRLGSERWDRARSAGGVSAATSR
ncbi:MAG: hypothetical protein JWN44_5944 [Myxococcales bacterium]|nr:hypothetical protein [Myxococcales bacterium]